MRDEIKYVIAMVSLGIGLVTYANSNFITKDLMGMLISRLDRIEIKIDKLSDN